MHTLSHTSRTFRSRERAQSPSSRLSIFQGESTRVSRAERLRDSSSPARSKSSGLRTESATGKTKGRERKKLALRKSRFPPTTAQQLTKGTFPVSRRAALTGRH